MRSRWECCVRKSFSFFFFWIDRRTQKWKKMKIKAEINSAVNTIYPGINKAALRSVGYLKFKLQILFGFFFFFSGLSFYYGSLSLSLNPFAAKTFARWLHALELNPDVAASFLSLSLFLSSLPLPFSISLPTWCHCPGSGCCCIDWDAPVSSLREKIVSFIDSIIIESYAHI